MLNSSLLRVAATLAAVSVPFTALSLAPEAEATLPMSQYEVRITNVTRGQIFSPPVVATHGGDLAPLFTLGAPASSELAGIAEDALNQPMIDMLNASGAVGDVQVAMGQAGPIMPGETATVILNASGTNSMLSMVGMLVVTNDAFFGANRVELPRRRNDVLRLRSLAYDAGSEANTEDCAHIPGPPCGNPMMRVTTGAEGYVHVHAGVHGIGSLTPSMHDWRGPVAEITIRRM